MGGEGSWIGWAGYTGLGRETSSVPCVTGTHGCVNRGDAVAVIGRGRFAVGQLWVMRSERVLELLGVSVECGRNAQVCWSESNTLKPQMCFVPPNTSAPFSWRILYMKRLQR